MKKNITAAQFVSIVYADSPKAANDSKIVSAYGINFNANVPNISHEKAAILLQCKEVYNRGSEEVILKNEILKMNTLAAAYVQKQDKNLGPEFILVKVGEWAFLPHQFYIGYTKSGGPIEFTENFGDRKFKGNKYPSRPEVIKKFF